jgi:hypothetical protein
MAITTVTTTVTKIELVTDLEFAEYDKAGILKATYVESGFHKGSKRVDVVVSEMMYHFKHWSKRLIL